MTPALLDPRRAGTGDIAIRSEVSLPMDGGHAPALIAFTGFTPPAEHFALRFGELRPGVPPLVRVHSECITGDLLRSQRCDCGAQLEESIDRVSAAGGLILYLRQEGRGIGLYAKIEAYRLQDQGLDTFEANERMAFPRDAREYGCAAAMLRALGVARVRLITNNPQKSHELERLGIEVVEVLPTGAYFTPHNERYLEAKARVTRHTIAARAGRGPAAAAID